MPFRSSATSMNLGSPETAQPLSPGVPDPDPGSISLDLLLNGAMETGQFLHLAISVAAALCDVHNRGLVHRDVKPANILVNTGRDHAWLTSLGTASRVPRERQAPEPLGFISGTLSYMAPEQTGRMNRSVDSRSDLYALGVTLYEMLTGTLPFTAADPMELVHSHIARQPTPPFERVKGIPRAVSAIIMKLLAKTAEERYQTAAGLESDLRRCLAEWQTQQRIEDFSLGEHDTPDRLLIPEKLYGRESAVDALFAAFDRVVVGGKPELVLVRGYSGIGKSSVVNELHKSLVPSRGLFASGKFDQHQRNIPYSTLAHAFQSLIRVLLGKSEGELSQWRDSLRDALGPNAKLIVNLVPELQLIVGEPPLVPDLPPQDAQRRFQFVMRRFIGVFARSEHPLCLFLDDLQWLDSATLELIEDLLTQSDVRHLMLVGAYRDNEVNASHPLVRKLDAIRKAGTSVCDIVLAPLSREDLAQFVTDALHCRPEAATALADLVHEKTAGNPFFAIQFVSALAEEGLLTFDHGERLWRWNPNRIRAKGYTDNVVDLMVGKLNRLPIETQQALQLLACIGNYADFALVEMVSQQSREQCQRQLWEAIRAGLIFATEHSYRFLHDRVQEAAYSLIPEESRAAVHLRIGRLLATHTPADKREERIFDIVNQLNRGSQLITSAGERKRLAELNFIAGRRAKSSTAYAAALAYLGAARAMLTDESWNDEYERIFSIEYDTAECELLTADIAAAEKRLSMLAQRARCPHDIALVTRLRVTLYVILDRSDRAIEICLEYLRSRGTDWSPNPTREEVVREYDRIWMQLGKRGIEALIDLPLMTDPDVLDVMDVLGEVITPAFGWDRHFPSLVICRMVNLSLEHGNSHGSCVAYVGLAMIATLFGNYDAGSRFGRLGYDLTEQRGLRRFRARTYMVFGSIVMPWTAHVRAGRDLIRRAFDAAQEVGDLTFAAYGRSHLVRNLLMAGDPLAEAQLEAENGVTFTREARYGLLFDNLSTQLAFIRTLRGLTTRFGWLGDSDLDELRMEQHLSSNPTLAIAACWYWIRKLQARYLAGHPAAALDCALKAQPLLWRAPLHPERAEFSFYAALAHAASWDGASPEAKQQHFDALKAHCDQIDTWAQHSPENFENRAALLTAEIARIEGRELDAMRSYERAIHSALVNGFVHNEAIACEAAARFYAARGFDAFADLYLRRARNCYQRWGADAKVRQLLEQYPRLRENEPALDSSGTSGAPGEQLDLATVLKVSQAVSGEMILDRLLERLMRAAIEHAGAERGLLIARQGDELQIQAHATTSGEDVTVHLRGSDHAEAALPQSLVRYVMRTRGTVILEDASSQNMFSADPYFEQHRARSILCLPLIGQGNLIGVLYLENNLAPRVFAPARITVLKLLASQAAMSLENTRLYLDVAKREAKIRRLVDANVVGILIWDLDGAILEANDAFLRMVGYERQDLISGRLRWTDLTPAEWYERDLELLPELKRTGSLQPFEKEYLRKDGSRVPVVVAVASFENENQGVGFVLDLTERKRVEQGQRQSEAYLAESQRLTQTGSWALNPVTGTVNYWSDEMFRIYGMDARRGSPPTYDEMLRVLHPEDIDRIHEVVQNTFRDKAELVLDFRNVMADGTVRHVHSIGHPVLDKTGALVEYFGTLVDVTERKRAEQRLLAQHSVARILAEVATVEEATPKILQAMCECMGWEVGIGWRIDREAGALRCADVWRKPSVEAAQFEAATRASTFRLGSGLPGRVWESHTPAQESYADIAARAGLHAAFALPIMLGSEVLGVISFLSRDVWRPDQDLLDMMATIGSQIGQFAKRAAAEQALRQSEAYLTEAQRLTHTGSWAYTRVSDGRALYWSNETFRLFGMDPEGRTAPTLEEVGRLIHRDEREQTIKELVHTFRAKAEYEQKYRIVLPDGTVRHLHSIGHPVLDGSGELVEYVGTIMDVTERRRAEQRLLAQHHVARILAEAATMEEATPKILQAVCECMGWDVGVRWRIDREAGVLRAGEVWYNPSVAPFEAATQTSTFRLGSGLPGRVWESRTPAQVPDVVHDPDSYTDGAARAGVHAAFALPILLGSEVLGVIGFFSRDVWQVDPDLLAMMATLGNQIGQFTKRAAAVDEAQLRVSMLHHIPVAACSVTPDGTPDIVNQLWIEYTGQTTEYVNSHPEAWMAAIHPEDLDRASSIYWDGIRSGQGFTMEARLLRARDGAYRWHLNRAVPVRDSEGNILRFVGTFTDVHDWRQAQEDLRNTQAELAHTARVLTMGELTASIAHEVNQPLGAIVTSAAAGERWLAATPPQVEKVRRALERIVNDGKRAGEVIKRIRALMKRQTPQKGWLEINEAIREVIAIVQHQLGGNDVTLETQLAEGLPLVLGDRVQLQQVLLNLVVNAIEAMSSIDERPRELTIVSAADGPGGVAVEVRDSGMGLDPERATRLFEPFYTTKAEGIGIGLSISRTIVEAHGGHLSATANVPHGAVFRFSLPVDEPLP